MYCPKCLNNTLRLSSRGVVNLVINGKQMDAGRFLYNTQSMDKRELLGELTQKIEEFFKWYSGFRNQSAIEVVEIITSDVQCEEGCNLPLNQRISIVDVLISSKELRAILDRLGEKYSMNIQLKNS